MILKRGKFEADVSWRGDIAVLRLLNDKYHADSLDALDAQFRALEAEASTGLIVVDLEKVSLLSSTALRAIRASHARLEKRAGRIVAAGGGDLVRSVLRFAPFIHHHDAVEEAVSALSAEKGS